MPCWIPEADAGMGTHGSWILDPEELAGHAQVNAPMTCLAAVAMAKLGNQVFAPSLPALNEAAPKGQLKQRWLLGAGNRPLAQNFNLGDCHSLGSGLQTQTNGFNLG
jgi:hypothetical protein